MLIEQTVHDSWGNIEDFVVLGVDLTIDQAVLLDHQVLKIFYLVMLLCIWVDVLRSVDVYNYIFFREEEISTEQMSNFIIFLPLSEA